MAWQSAGLALLLVSGCRCKSPETVAVPPVAAARQPHSQTSWAPHEPPETPDDVYGVPAWSKVFALAFERRVSIGVPSCFVADGGCAGRDALQLRGEPTVSKDWLLGADEPISFIGEQVTFLEEPKRHERLVRAIDEAMKIEPGTAPIAAVLFQADLWERIDAIGEAISTEPTADWKALEDLRGRLAKLMRHVALSKEQLEAIGDHTAKIERTFPELLSGFTARDGWAEILTSSTPRHGSAEWSSTTGHAERHGFRMVFRVFVHHPAGRGPLEATLRTWPEPFPKGSRFVITGAPLHRTREGDLVPAPFIVLLETRQAMAAGELPGSVGQLPHDVLHGSRARLTRTLRDDGGLEKIDRDALIPVGATCMPDFTTRIPSASSCTMCHGPAGNRVKGPMNRGEVKVSITDDPTAAGQSVATAKRSSASFAFLDW